MKIIIRSWHNSEKETKGLASVGLKHGEIVESPYKPTWEWVGNVVDRIFNTGLNVMLAHSSEPDSIMVGVSDDLFTTR